MQHSTIQVLDNDGERIMLTELRLDFRRYEVAESYARFYRDMYSQQRYKFRVIGLRKEDVKNKKYVSPYGL
jgi:hypothetical protein